VGKYADHDLARHEERHHAQSGNQAPCIGVDTAGIEVRDAVANVVAHRLKLPMEAPAHAGEKSTIRQGMSASSLR